MTDRIDHWRSDASCSGMGRSWDTLTTHEQIDLCHAAALGIEAVDHD